MGSEVVRLSMPVAERFALTPMQAGMLFHSLRGSAPGVDILQIEGDLQEALDVPRFTRTWTDVAKRHAVFGTRFSWKHDGPPVQELDEGADVEVIFEDWRGRPAKECETSVARELNQSRRAGFNLEEPPLMHIKLIQLGDQHFKLLWTTHHALLDAQSLGLVVKDVFSIYEAPLAGGAFTIHERPPFKQHAAWLESQNWATSEAFWQKYLQGFGNPATIRLPRPDHAASTDLPPYGEVAAQVNSAATASLRTFAREHGLALSTLVHGAWALLLRAYAGVEDVVFGSVRGGRQRSSPGAEEGVGLYINTIPVRARLDPSATVLQWLRNLREEAVACRAHEHTPLPIIQACSELGKGQALFETLVNIQDPAWHDRLKSLGGRWFNRSFRVVNQPNYPLSLDVYGGNELALKFWYDRNRFTTATMERMIASYANLLRSLPDSASNRLKEVSIISAEERSKLTEWNATAGTFPDETCVYQAVEACAGATPNALAACEPGGQMHYGDLNKRANQLARQLQKLGVSRDLRVAVCMERSPELLVAWLAVWKAGGAFVCLDPAYPPARLHFMVQDSTAQVVLTEQALVRRLPKDRPMVVLDSPDTKDHLNSLLPDNMPPLAGPEDLAYIIYTSGSTGQPKGVAIRHRSLMNLVAWTQKSYGVGPASRATQVASPAFDAAVWETWPYLAAGASIHFPDPDTLLDPNELFRWFAEHQITHTFLPTPLAETVLDVQPPKKLCLRWILTGGDRLRRYPSSTAPFRLVNHYGPTEYTVVTTAGEVTSNPDSEKLPHIGRPIANTNLYALDGWQQRVPIGVPGELHIGGVGLAREYINQPDLTQARFTPDPFSGGCQGRLYRTGDLVRYREDGAIEFIGRLDFQVKVRGYRIELGEIESLLGRFPGIRQVVVWAHATPREDNRLVAYYVSDQDVEEAAVREFLQLTLPDYMVPDVFVRLAAIPVTANGKLDRSALPVPAFEAPLDATGDVPRGQVEILLAQVWQEVLKIGAIHRTDNFFRSGGHSLLAIQVVSRLHRVFGIEIGIRDVFGAPNLAELAARVELALRAAAGSAQEHVPAIIKAAEPALSFGQERLWFLEQFQPGLPLYNIPLALDLEGRLCQENLKRSLNTIIARHAVLRTSFSYSNGRPLPVVAPELTLDLPFLDLSFLPADEAQRKCQELTAAEAQTPLPLDRAPLIRARLLRLAPNRHRLLLTFHHAACDGWSLGIFYREWAAAYASFAEGKSICFGELPISYMDFAAWQREEDKAGHFDLQLSYWQKKLSGKLPVLDIPTDRPRPARQSYRGGLEVFTLSTEIYRELKQLAAREGVTLFMLLLAVFKALLHRYTAQEDIIVGSPIAGRQKVETEGVIGLFLNTLPLRTTVTGDLPFRELLSRVRSVSVEALAHQDIPFERLVETLAVERDLSRSPLFQVMFNLHPAVLPPHEFGGLSCQSIPVHSASSKFDLSLTLADHDTELFGSFEFNSNLFDAETVRRMVGHYITLIQAVLANPIQLIAKLNLLPQAELELVLKKWNQTRAEYEHTRCIHQVFERQVQRAPNAIAAVCGEEEITFIDLNRRANRLAWRLRELGVGPDVRVGIRVTRSLEMLVGMYAVLKAGGAYVPMDPSYPTDRLAYMLEDSQAPLVLTQAALLPTLPPLKATVLCLDDSARDASGTPLSNFDDQVPVSGVTPDHLAYVIYTSGSTGKPKGVMVQHCNVVNFFTGMDQAIGSEPGVWLAVTSISFDISVLELFWTLARGFKVVLHGDESAAARSHYQAARKNGRALARYSLAEEIQRHGVTHLQCTPSMAGMMVEDPSTQAALKTVKRFFFGGEPLSPSLLEKLDPQGRVYNMYGPTETTIWSTVKEVTKESSLTIGRPIANTEVYLLDAHGQPVPIGIPGELFIGGAGVVRGYLHRPELTAERFVPNPFGSRGGDRLYRTGDLTRYRPNGEIEFLGRLDHQVKIRGFRIELGEIESALRAHSDISETVVSVWEPAPDDKRLVAYYVVNPGAKDPGSAELRKLLKAKLPDYMVPSAFVMLPTLPLTPNGKIDRKALPPPQSNPAVQAVGPATATDMETRIAAIWEELLRTGRLGLDDNFFESGGHSLLAVEAQSRIQDRLSVKFPVIKLFEYPTARTLARYLQDQTADRVVMANIDVRAKHQRQAFGFVARPKPLSAP